MLRCAYPSGTRTVVLTPHVGTSTVDTRLVMARMALDNLLAGLEGRELPYRVAPP